MPNVPVKAARTIVELKLSRGFAEKFIVHTELNIGDCRCLLAQRLVHARAIVVHLSEIAHDIRDIATTYKLMFRCLMNSPAHP